MALKRVGGGPINEDAFAWENKNARIVKEFTCFIPKKIHDVVRSAAEILVSTEFSFLLKCEIDYNNRTVDIDPDSWFFPKQTVTPGSVIYHEDMAEYNCVMHKHPGSMKSFSGTDDEWINQNFQVSVLWIRDGFCNGRINIPTPAGRVQLPLKVITEPDYQTIDTIESIIKEKVVIPPTPERQPHYTQIFKNFKGDNNLGLLGEYHQTTMFGGEDVDTIEDLDPDNLDDTILGLASVEINDDTFCGEHIPEVSEEDFIDMYKDLAKDPHGVKDQ